MDAIPSDSGRVRCNFVKEGYDDYADGFLLGIGWMPEEVRFIGESRVQDAFVYIEIHFLSEAFRPSEESAKSSRSWLLLDVHLQTSNFEFQNFQLQNFEL